MSNLMVMEDYVPNVENAVAQWKAYIALCSKEGILDEGDYQKIIVKEKDPVTGKYVPVEREFKKKSAWQKLARAFNVNTKIIEKEYQRTKTGAIKEAYYLVQATLPNGRCVESDALCSRSEKGKSKVSDHTIMSTAKTRATNRAISELIGAGEVSSEEMNSEFKYDKELPVRIVDEIPENTKNSLHEEDGEVIETVTDDSEQIFNKEYVHKEAPVLISDCIDALINRGMKVTNEIVRSCIEDRCKDKEEYDLCMSWLDKNVNLEGGFLN